MTVGKLANPYAAATFIASDSADAEDAKLHESLGLDAESAKNIRDAVVRAKTDADLKKWFPQVDAGVKKAKEGRLSKKDAVPLFGKISEGLEKAERMGLSEAAKRLRDAAEVIRPVAETVEQGDVGKFNYSAKGQKLNNRLGGTDKRGNKTVSLDTKKGTVDVGTEEARPDAGGGRAFAGYSTEVKGVEGDKVTLAHYDKNDNFIRNEEVSLDELRKRGKTIPEYADLAKKIEESGEDAEGESIRFSNATGEAASDLPTEWTPETQKPLENFAEKVLKPTGLVKGYEFAPRPENVDGANAIRRKDGTVVGEYDRKTGRAKFFPGARAEDITHEFTHGLFQHAEQEAAAGRPQLKQTIDKLIKAMPQVWKDAVGRDYADRPAAEVLEEIFTNGLARLGETGVKGRDAKTGEIIPGREGSGAMAKAMRTLEGKAWYNRAWNAIKELYRDFMRRHGWYNARLDNLDRMTPDEAARHILGEMAKGRNFGDVSVAQGEGTRNAVRQEEYDRWNRVLDAYERGELKPNSHATVFEHTPAVLKRLGAPDLPVTLDKDVIDKIAGIVKTQSGGRHDIPVSELRDLQIELDNPIAVFDSKTQPNAKVVLTRIVDRQNNERAVVALHLDREEGRSAIRVNRIASAYGKDQAKLQQWVNDGLLRYANKQARDSYSKWLQLPPDSELRARSILTEKDFSGEELGRIIPEAATGRKGESEESSVRQSRRTVLPPKPTNDDVKEYIDDKEGFGRRMRRMFQDKNIGIRDVEERLGITDKEESTYYAKDRAFGKNEHELTHLQKQEVEPIVEKIHKSGGDLGLFSAYLYARHSGERNAALKAREGVENGSGMNAEQAKAIFDAVDRLGLRAAFEDAAKDVWAMNRKYLQRRVDSGRMTQADYDFYTKQYEHYVPLRTDMTNEELDIFNSSTGGWKRNELMTAKGRTSAADDPLAFSIVQNEQAIRASNANEVRKRWAGVVRKSIGQGAAIGEVVDGVNKGGAKWSFTFGDGETVETGSPMKLASERDDIILF